jgi:hypothetical protein
MRAAKRPEKEPDSTRKSHAARSPRPRRTPCLPGDAGLLESVVNCLVNDGYPLGAQIHACTTSSLEKIMAEKSYGGEESASVRYFWLSATS